MSVEVLHAFAPHLANYVPVTKGMYDYALSNTCVITFLVQGILAVIVYFDAMNRGLYGPMWAFLTFALIYIGIFIYIIYILAFGYTRFHIVKDPEAEEIKRKWEDTESTLDREREEKRKEKMEKRWTMKSEKDDDLPYRRV